MTPRSWLDRPVLVTATGMVLAALLLSACGSSSASSATAQAAGTKASASSGNGGVAGKKVIALNFLSTNPWTAYFGKVFTAAMQKDGASVQDEFTGDASTQVQQFNEAIAEHPAVIAIEIIDDAAVIPSIRMAAEQHVPVVAYDGPPPLSVISLLRTVESNNAQLGMLAAQNLVDGMKSLGLKSGNYAILSGLIDNLIAQQRLQGFAAYMKAYPQYHLLQTVDTDWSTETATTAAVQLFAKYGSGLNAVYGMADYLALPAIQAAQQAGRTPGKNVIVVGGNCFAIGISAIEKGTYYGTATEDPGTIATQTADYIAQFLDGKNPPQHEMVDEARITKADVAQYAAQCSHA
jgi:ABC-type sugar transport system substrate-binding protein